MSPNISSHSKKYSYSKIRAHAKRVVSEKITFLNRSGKTIIGYYDHQLNKNSDLLVVISPGYAETKKDYISLAYYLSSNGLDVIRYDNSYHLGESQGEIFETDPIHMVEDLSSTLDYVQENLGYSSCGVVASSLSGRIALRVATKDSRIKALVSLVGVVDLQKSLLSVYREDIIREYGLGRRWDSLDLFGHEVKGTIIKSIVENGLHDLQGTCEDVQRLGIPVTFIAAERDVWVDLKDVRKVYEASLSGKTELCVIPGSLHQIQENPRRAKDVICKIVLACLRHLGHKKVNASSVKEPDIREIVFQNKIELVELKKLTTVTRNGERVFWGDYLSRYSIAYRSADFKEFLDFVGDLLGNVVFGEKILDAGCGNGLFGAWLTERSRLNAERCSRGDWGSKPLFQYFGLDFSYPGLLDAAHRHERCVAELYAGSWAAVQPEFGYILGDLDEGLPFLSSTFDKINCNLVISYVSDAQLVLRGLMRSLKEGGKLSVSSLKPYCDLSLIYRNYADSTITDKERQEAKALLSSTGQIRKKEGEGHYRFFTGPELQELLVQAGARRVKVVRTFGDQANVAVGEK